MSIISADNAFALGAFLMVLAWLGFWIDNHPIGRKTSGVVWVLVLSMVLSNIGVVPFESPTYGFAFDILVPVAIPLLLFKADLRRIFRESGPVMLTFLIAAVGTVIGALVGFFLLDLGDIGPKAAGIYTGGWIGGAVNLLAVSDAVEMSPEELTIALSASSVVSVLALLALVTIPTVRWITQRIPLNLPADIDTTPGRTDPATEEPVTFNLIHISGALAISFTLCAIGKFIGQQIGTDQYDILFITILAIAVANLFPRQMSALTGDFESGMLCMYLFFAAIGAGTNATAFLESAVALFVYGCIIIGIHLTVVLGAAKLLKIDLAEAIAGSGAALVGPAATAAVATSKGWRHLVTPAIMCGIFGYAIATFIGVAVTRLLS